MCASSAGAVSISSARQTFHHQADEFNKMHVLAGPTYFITHPDGTIKMITKTEMITMYEHVHVTIEKPAKKRTGKAADGDRRRRLVS